jgi:hypothetical protein
MRYVSIRQVLNYVPKNIREEEANDSLLVSWALMALRRINPTLARKRYIVFMELENHRLQLSDEVRKIHEVSYLGKNFNDKDADRFCQLLTPELVSNDNASPVNDNTEGSELGNISNYAIYYRLFMDSDIKRNYFEPMQFMPESSSDHLLARDCINRSVRCKEKFTVDEFLILTSTIKEGLVFIDYSADVTDSDGNFLIPDNEALKQALGLYIEVQHWSNRLSVHEEGAFRIHESKLQQYGLASKKAKGSDALRNTHLDTIAELKVNSGIRTMRTAFDFVKDKRYIY